jgi:hypothetical protein
MDSVRATSQFSFDDGRRSKENLNNYKNKSAKRQERNLILGSLPSLSADRNKLEARRLIDVLGKGEVMTGILLLIRLERNNKKQIIQIK